MTTQWLYNEVGTITENNLNLLKTKFSKLTANQLNWKPNPTIWSLNEIFSHLNAYALFYHRVMLDKIETTRFKTPRINFVSSPLGKSAWGSMKLGNARNVKRKFKAPGEYNPTLSPALVKEDALQALIQHQQDFMGLIEKSIAVNLRKVKVPISVSKFVRLRLGDALLFVAYHNDRHIQQALNLLSESEFPKK